MTPFVEIAAKPLLKVAFPEQTTYFSTYHNFECHDPPSASYSVTASTLPRLWRSLRHPDVKLVVCEPTMFAPWSASWLGRAVFDRRLLQGHCPLLRTWGPQLLRFGRKRPLAVIDQDDLPLINRHNQWLLKRATVYFKRELPCDHWRLFMKTAHANLPSMRFRRSEPRRQLLHKIRPISLGLPPTFVDDAQRRIGPKRTDLFFSGQIENSSTVRASGISELRALQSQGWAIDIPNRRLAPDEYRQRMAQAWLTWSPEGLGWDCFRHYETLACGSVPIINSPSIERYKPLQDGMHAFYYHAEPGHLTRCIHGALADKTRLRSMATDGYRHVQNYHTQAALATYVISETLASAHGEAAPQTLAFPLELRPHFEYQPCETFLGGIGLGRR